MFKRILVPLDGSQLSESALPHAVLLARLFRSELTLLMVLEPSTSTTEPHLIDPLAWQLRKSESELYLQEQVRRLQEGGAAARHVVVEGRAAEAIVNYAQQEHVDLVVLSSHGQGGLTRWDVSSTVMKVITKVFLPVLVARAYRAPGEELAYRSILVPLDTSRRAECSLPVAAALAEASQARLLLATVVRRPELPQVGTAPVELTDLANQLVALSRQVVSTYLAEVKNRLPQRSQTFVLEGQSACRPLHELAEQEDADLVLMCAHGLSEALEYPYGSMAINHLLFGSRPVLVMQDVPPELARTTLAEEQAEKAGRR